MAPSLPSWCQQDRTPLDPLVWQSRSIPPRYGTHQDKCHFIPPWFYPPVLAIPFPALLTPPCHPRLGTVFPSGANFNGGVLQGGGPQGHFIPTLRCGKQIAAACRIQVPDPNQLPSRLPAEAMPGSCWVDSTAAEGRPGEQHGAGHLPSAAAPRRPGELNPAPIRRSHV